MPQIVRLVRTNPHAVSSSLQELLAVRALTVLLQLADADWKYSTLSNLQFLHQAFVDPGLHWYV